MIKVKENYGNIKKYEGNKLNLKHKNLVLLNEYNNNLNKV